MAEKELSADFLIDLLRSDGSIIVNKKMAHKIGLHEAIMYSELLSKYKYFEEKGELQEDGSFFNTVVNMQKDTTLSDHQQRKAIARLQGLGLIWFKTKGLPAKRYFKIIRDTEVERVHEFKKFRTRF
jgi:predicted amidohydrolase YtcJ